MPQYDYVWPDCQNKEEHIVPYNARTTPRPCKCGGFMDYTFTLCRTIWGGISGYDEALGVDINGRRERDQILKDKGLVQAGDKVGGSRNWEKNSEQAVGISEQQGLRYSDQQRAKEEARKAANDQVISVVNEDGSRKSVRYSELPTIDQSPVIESPMRGDHLGEG